MITFTQSDRCHGSRDRCHGSRDRWPEVVIAAPEVVIAAPEVVILQLIESLRLLLRQLCRATSVTTCEKYIEIECSKYASDILLSAGTICGNVFIYCTLFRKSFSNNSL